MHGQLQVEIDITEKGPQIRLNGGQLDLTSPEHIGLDCQSFRIHTAGDTDIVAKGRVSIDAAANEVAKHVYANVVLLQV